MCSDSKILILSFDKLKFYSIIDVGDLTKIYVSSDRISIFALHVNGNSIDEIFRTDNQSIVNFVFKEIVKFAVTNDTLLFLDDKSIEKFYEEKQ